MGDDIAETIYTREDRQRYRTKVRRCLDVFEAMLANHSFDSEEPLTGLEIELNLVNAQWQPDMANDRVLEAIADPAFQTELGQYNIEFNVPPTALPGNALAELEAALRTSLDRAEAKANESGSEIIMIGILPTLMAEHFAAGWMSQNPRYAALQDAIFSARREDLELDIAGPEHLRMYADTIAPESACTSVQLHLQVAPSDFAAHWNAAQALAGPQLALAANSPFLFGHHLWAETRTELFLQATDTRSPELRNQGVRPPVFFGERWITSIFDLFEENVRTTSRPCCRRPRTRILRRCWPPVTPRNCRSSGCTTAPSTGGTDRCTTWSTAYPTCGWRTGCCRPGRPWWTCLPTRPSTTARSACWPPRTVRSGRR